MVNIYDDDEELPIPGKPSTTPDVSPTIVTAVIGAIASLAILQERKMIIVGPSGELTDLEAVKKIREEEEMPNNTVIQTLETAVEEVWQNQRWMVRWATPLAVERSPFSDKSGSNEMVMEAVLLPYLWEWVNDWAVVPHASGPDAVEGWFYARDFTTSIKDCRIKPGVVDVVRRRCWRRSRTRISSQLLTKRVQSNNTGHKYWCERERYGFSNPDPPPPAAYSWIEDRKQHNSRAAWDSFILSNGGYEHPLRIEGKPGDLKGKLKTMIKEHPIPAALRSKVWLDCSGAARKKRENLGYYDVVVSKQGNHNEGRADLEKDLARTFPDHPYINSPLAPGRIKLRRILLCLSYRNPLVNYCQSFNFIAASLLLNMGEEDAFWLMVTLLETIFPNDYYNNHLVGITVDLRVISDLIAHHLSALNSHFQQYNIDITPFTAGWVMNLFVGVFPIESAMRIWDLIFMEGCSISFRVILGLLKVFETDLLKCTSLGEALELITDNTKQLFDIREVIRTGYSFKLNKQRLARLRQGHRKDVEKEVDMRKVVDEVQDVSSEVRIQYDVSNRYGDSWKATSPLGDAHGDEQTGF